MPTDQRGALIAIAATIALALALAVPLTIWHVRAFERRERERAERRRMNEPRDPPAQR